MCCKRCHRRYRISAQTWNGFIWRGRFYHAEIGRRWFLLRYSGGYVVEKELKAGEMFRVDTGCIVAFTKDVHYDIEFVRGVRNVIFGGEGLFYATLRGPGKVWIQSIPISRLASRILSYGTTQRGKESGSILGPLGNIIGRE